MTIDTALLRSKSKNTPFAGRTVTGRVAMTMCEGRVVHENVVSVGSAGRAQKLAEDR